MKKTRKTIWAGLVSFSIIIASIIVAACEDDNGGVSPSDVPLRVARLGESFHQAVGAVVINTLEDIGHPVEFIEGPHAELYPRFANGEAHVLATGWLPNGHSTYWNQYGDQFVRLGNLYEHARFFWAVPSYIPPSAVSSIADLTRSDVVAQMNLEIQGVTPGAGLMRVSRQAMEQYGLTNAGYTLLEGTVPLLIEHVDEMIEAQEWFVTPLWQPQFLNQVYDFRVLSDPNVVLGRDDGAFLLGNAANLSEVPEETLAILRRIHLTVRDVSQMDLWINREGMTPEQAARRWMNENQQIVRIWREGGPVTDVGNILPSLALAVRNYFHGVNYDDADIASSGFGSDAFVVDGARFEGQSAIRNWIARSVLPGSYRLLEIRSQDESRVSVVLTFAPAGTANAEARPRALYTFELDNLGQIRSLTIGGA